MTEANLQSDFETIRKLFPFMDEEDAWEIVDSPGGLKVYLEDLERQKKASDAGPKTRRELEETDDLD